MFKLSDAKPIFDRIRNDEKQRVVKNLMLNLLIFGVYMIATSVAESIVAVIIMIPRLVQSIETGGQPDMSFTTPGDVLMMLFLTLISIGLTFVLCLCIERRKLRTLGLTKRNALRDYLIGACVGLLMMTATVLTAQAGGAVRYLGRAEQIPWGMMAAFITAWLIQGFSEELTFRGYLMMSAGTHQKQIWVPVLASALCFAAAHFGNDGISVFAAVNLTLFGVLMSLYFLRTDSIWGVAALHSAWNMAQGNVFGLKVSGIDVGVTFLRYEMTDDKVWLNGGGFGLEGGAATTLVLAAAILLVLFLPKNEK